MELPNHGDDEFDKDITGEGATPNLGEEPIDLALVLMFMEMHESFLALLAAGFTEPQALRFLAYCLAAEGD
jgi:hypothetical protein